METKSIKTLIIFLTMVMTACLIISGPVLSKEINLKYAGLLPPGVTLSAPVDEWGKLVEERTGGQVKLTTYHAQSLGKFQDFPKMVNGGLCEMAFMGPPTPGFELLGAFELPFVMPSSMRVGIDMLNAVYRKGLFSDMFEKKGFKPMFFMNSDPRYIWTTKKVVKNMDQLKEMKLRGTTPVHIEVAKALGATAVWVSPADVYMALERGTVDGAINSTVGVLALKLYESLKYVLWEPVTTDLSVVVMSLKVWNSLPAEVKVVMQEVNDEMRYRYMNYYNSNAEYEIMTKEKGIEIYKFSSEERTKLQNALYPVTETWINKNDSKGFPAREVVEMIQKLSKEY